MSIEIIKLNGNTIIDVTQFIPVAGANWELSNNGAGTIYLSDTLPVDSTDFARVLNVNNPTLVYPIAVSLYAWADKGVSASLSFSSSVGGGDASNKIDNSEKGAPNGVGTLDANAKQPLSQVNDTNILSVVGKTDAVTGFTIDGGTGTSKSLILAEDATIDQDIQKTASVEFASIKNTGALSGVILSDVDGLQSSVAKVPNANLTIETSMLTPTSTLNLADIAAIIEYVANQTAGGVTYRREMPVPADLTTSATGNTYADGATSYKVGDMFIAASTGDITVSDGTIPVVFGDALIIGEDILKANITIAMIDVIDATSIVSSVAGKTGAVVIDDVDVNFTDNTTGNFNILSHGYCPKSFNLGYILQDDGQWISNAPQQPVSAVVNLETAGSFAMLAQGTVTNSGSSSVTGDVGGIGVISGFANNPIAGSFHENDAIAIQAISDLSDAHIYLTGLSATQTHSATYVDGEVLAAGVYFNSAAANLSGEVTLDGGGDPNAKFVFQFGAAATWAANASIQLINGANVVNVYFVSVGALTLGAGCLVSGTYISQSTVVVGAGSYVNGGLYSTASTIAFNSSTVLGTLTTQLTQDTVYDGIFYKQFSANDKIKLDSITPSAISSLTQRATTQAENTNVADNAPFSFSTVVDSVGTGIVYSSATKRWTLEANKTYLLSGAVNFNNGSYVRFCWYDITGSAQIGAAGQYDNIASVTSTNMVQTTFTPSVATEIELRNISSTTVTVGADSSNELYPQISIMQLPESTVVNPDSVEVKDVEVALGQVINGSNGSTLTISENWDSLSPTYEYIKFNLVGSGGLSSSNTMRAIDIVNGSTIRVFDNGTASLLVTISTANSTTATLNEGGSSFTNFDLYVVGVKEQKTVISINTIDAGSILGANKGALLTVDDTGTIVGSAVSTSSGRVMISNPSLTNGWSWEDGSTINYGSSNGTIPFSTVSGTHIHSSLFNYDNVNTMLGLGETTPTEMIHLKKAAAGGDVAIRFEGGNDFTIGLNDGYGDYFDISPSSTLSQTGIMMTQNGDVSIGTVPSSATKLKVQDDDGSGAIVEFRNKNTGTAADVLRIWMDTPNPDSSNYFIEFTGDASNKGEIRGNGTGVSYQTTSDRRVKDNIKRTQLSLNDLMKLDVVEFTVGKNKRHAGLIAQDAYDVYPEAVEKGSETDEITQTDGKREEYKKSLVIGDIVWFEDKQYSIGEDEELIPLETSKPEKQWKDLEVEYIKDKLVAYTLNQDGKAVWGLSYGDYVPLMIKSIQDLKRELDDLKKSITN